MNEAPLSRIRDLIQEDVGKRGLRTDPDANLITAWPDDFAAACRSLAETPTAALAVLTGFFIPHGRPPSGETDGPLGALFLARALVPLGLRVVLATDAFCIPALEAGLAWCGLRKSVPVIALPTPAEADTMGPAGYVRHFQERSGPLTHLVALERVGPSHTPESLRNQPESSAAFVVQYQREVPAKDHDRCHTMGGRDITDAMSPAHWLLEAASEETTIGIGDGGNEIGMGKIPWHVLRRNIPGGGLVACRVSADHLIVCGVSNWGAYGLAAGVRLLRAAPADPALFAVEREQQLLEIMVERGPLVDGMSGQPAATVDGLEFERYAEPLYKLGEMGP